MGTVARYAIRIGTASVLLAGCGGSQPPVAPGAIAQSHAIPPDRAIVHRIVTAASSVQVLYNFPGFHYDGASPSANLLNVGDTLVGPTVRGGTDGVGMVFGIGLTTGKEDVLDDFSGKRDGEYPNAELIDVRGALYGTTEGGGTHSAGTVFSVSTTGSEHVLSSFDGSDGGAPTASLIEVHG